MTPALQIRVDPTAIYSVRLYLGDPTVERDDVSVYFGTSYPVPTITPAYTVSTLANEFDTTVTTGLSSPSGILYIRIVGNGTLNNDFSIVGLDLWKTGAPAHWVPIPECRRCTRPPAP